MQHKKTWLFSMLYVKPFLTAKSAEVAKVKPIFPQFSPIMSETYVQEKAYIAYAG
jgi:hypothetical protein